MLALCALQPSSSELVLEKFQLTGRVITLSRLACRRLVTLEDADMRAEPNAVTFADEKKPQRRTPLATR